MAYCRTARAIPKHYKLLDRFDVCDCESVFVSLVTVNGGLLCDMAELEQPPDHNKPTTTTSVMASEA